ncbi:hypothetical protein D9611_000018 [Ephemerocybe angulata]|uniref:DUF300-domain-containing protein n=1 Tax=Ephemerocybe angulata TaxID=980116 RepID=A0A8H5F6R4_9AGAR|nr:hypothetical protein D9611_000018 [Tulosesus angulatus]
MGSNSTCHKHVAAEDPPGIFQSGGAVFRAYHIGWIICGCFTAVATVASFWLINKHLQWYTNKREQRYIVRLLFLVPIYALISFASFLFWNNATPLILVRDAYEAIVLTAFFYLLLAYISPDPEEQRRVFLKSGLSKSNDNTARQRGTKLQRWMFPLGFVKKKPKDGLYFLQLMKWGVLQYCVIRPVTALAAVILDYSGHYCEASWSPVWGHVWIVIIISISVTIAMYCLIQLYIPVAGELKPHRPILKLFSVKAVVFLTFWQATLLSALSMLGVVKGTSYMTAEDINIGIGAILECFEMMIFAFVHIKAFTYKPYRPFHNPMSKDPPPSRTPRLRSLGHALDFRETFREIWMGCVYMFDKMRGREPRHDFGARRAAHYEEAFGQARPAQPKAKKGVAANRKANQPNLSPSDITIRQEVEVDVSGERQWLGLGDDYGYGLGYFRRQKSERLSVQIGKELQARGYSPEELPARVPTEHGHLPLDPDQDVPAPRRRSWWRSIYDHISQSSHHHHRTGTDNSLTPSLPRRLQSKDTRSRRQSEAQRTLLQHEGSEALDLEDAQPSNPIHPDSYARSPLQPGTPPLPSFHRIERRDSGQSLDSDVLAPLGAYRDRRKSNYRPKRHKRNTSSQGSSSALLPSPQQLEPIAHSPPESTIDMAEIDPRVGLGMHQHHDLNSLLSIPTPQSDHRPDSLLGRIFPPSEVSLDGRSRADSMADSAYSLPSIVSQDGAPRPTGDRRLHVHEHTYHPSASAHALHVPWTADVVHHHPGPGSPPHPQVFEDGQDYGMPPPLPEKDLNYVPSFRRSQVAAGPSRRESGVSHRHPRGGPRESGISLPSLPEDRDFEMPPHLIMRNDTARSSTLVDTPSSPQSAYFSDYRLSYGDSTRPPPSIVVQEEKGPPKPARKSLLPPSAFSSRPISTAKPSTDFLPIPTSSHHRRERAEKRQSSVSNVNDPDLDDQLSDTLSLSSFYTAVSQPQSTRRT